MSKKLSDLTTKRTIVIVLLLLFCLPLFESEFFVSPPSSHEYEVDLLGKILSANIPSSIKEEYKQFYIEMMSDSSTPLVEITFSKDGIEGISKDYSNLRNEEKDELIYDTGDNNYGTISSVISVRRKVVIESWLSLGRTLFVFMVLTFASLFFSKDANNLVLRPIQRMMDKINKIASNPMSAKEEKIVKDEKAGMGNETVDIENAIIKIGGLLALGFGDAGTEIVTQNITMSGDINPMLPGKKKLAIYGFCDIRNFTDATEILQEDVMVFVNTIGGIVHSVVDAFAGSANKNIGDAFLLVWKIPETEVEIDIEDNMFLSDTQLVDRKSTRLNSSH